MMRGSGTSIARKRDVVATQVGSDATDVVAGEPGSFVGGTPFDLKDLQQQQALRQIESGNKWTPPGQYVVLQDGSVVSWNGTPTASWQYGVSD